MANGSTSSRNRMQQMTDKVFKKDHSNKPKFKVKRRLDGSVRKTVVGDRVKWDDKLGEQRIVTKYRRSGAKKKEVAKKVTYKGKWKYDTSNKYEGIPDQTIGYKTNVRKYDKEGVEKSNKLRKGQLGGQNWDEKYKTSPKAQLKEVAKNVGYTLATLAGTAAIPLIGVAGLNAVNKRRFNKWAKENPGKGANNNPYR